ncbi:hypothetical protein Tco_1120450, partial [Tanacetum coccineum]
GNSVTLPMMPPMRHGLWSRIRFHGSSYGTNGSCSNSSKNGVFDSDVLPQFKQIAACISLYQPPPAYRSHQQPTAATNSLQQPPIACSSHQQPPAAYNSHQQPATASRFDNQTVSSPKPVL